LERSPEANILTGGIEMSRHMRGLPAVLVAGIALLLGARATVLRAQDQNHVPFEFAQIYFEVNSSAGDAGIQVSLDGEAWKELVIVDPNGRILSDIKGKGNVGAIGLTELFFEGDEPSFEEFPLDSILARFPEGTYHFSASTLNGQVMVGSWNLTHDIPNGPVILSPPEGGLVDPNHTVISWAPVTRPRGIQIIRYQVVIEHGGRTFSVDVPARTTRVTVSKEFLKPGTSYKFEVLAKEVSSNQTITEGSFVTE
jgi:hypothetical protein